MVNPVGRGSPSPISEQEIPCSKLSFNKKREKLAAIFKQVNLDPSLRLEGQVHGTRFSAPYSSTSSTSSTSSFSSSSSLCSSSSSCSSSSISTTTLIRSNREASQEIDRTSPNELETRHSGEFGNIEGTSEPHIKKKKELFSVGTAPCIAVAVVAIAAAVFYLIKVQYYKV